MPTIETSFVIRAVATAAALLGAASCDSSPKDAAASLDVVWDTLPSGAARAVYSSFPVFPFTTAVDLRIGGAGVDGAAAFADVRGIEVGPDSSILVLDAQASELRAFDAAGAYRSTLLRKGVETGGIGSANGLRVDTLGGIWVNDHGRGQVTSLRGGQPASHPLPTSGFGGIWEGGITHDGRVWVVERHAEGPSVPPTQMPADMKSGPQPLQTRLYLRSLDPATGAIDSVALGLESTEVAIYPMVMTPVPFAGTPLSAFDPAGALWTASSDTYRVTKLSLTGDTLLIVELPGIGPDASSQERADEIARVTALLADARTRGGAAGRGSDATDWEAAVGRRKPVLVSLSVDDQSRLWVQRRTLSRGPVFDVIDATGRLVGSIDPDFEPSPTLPPVIRGKGIYAVLADSAGAPTVIRAPVTFR
jgi:hypothetical protein